MSNKWKNDKGQQHRIDKYGNERWYLPYKGIYHRIDGPAIECTNGSKQWWVNGKPHRIDGPAMEWASGNKVWYIDWCEISNINHLFQLFFPEEED